MKESSDDKVQPRAGLTYSPDPLSVARAEGRKEGLEEAAKVADDIEAQHWHGGEAVGAKQVAATIRSLIE